MTDNIMKQTSTTRRSNGCDPGSTMTFFPSKLMEVWVMLAVLSSVHMISVVTFRQDLKGTNWWVGSVRDIPQLRVMVGVSSFSFALSLVAAYFHLRMWSAWSKTFCGTRYEWGLAFVLTVLWAADLGIMLTFSASSTFVDPSICCFNPNGFFSAWGSFIYIFSLLVSLSRTLVVRFREETSKCWFLWTWFSLSSIVLMISTSVGWDRWDREVDKIEIFALILSLFSFLTGIRMLLPIDGMIERWSAVLLFIGWCVGAGFFVYSSEEDNEALEALAGYNLRGQETIEAVDVVLYFSTWSAVFLLLNISTIGVWEWLKERSTSSASSENGHHEQPHAGTD